MIRGWCPTLYEPMATGDGLLVRVKPPSGRLPSAAARVLARQAARLGNGIVELTSRGNLQVRGLDAAGVPRFAASMVAMGLASADPAFERRRNITVSPLAGDDPTAAADAECLAGALTAMLEAELALAALPPKFDFAVDGGGVLPLPDCADIAIRTDGERHWIRFGKLTVIVETNTDVMAGLDPAIHAVRPAPGSASIVPHAASSARRHVVDHRIKSGDDVGDDVLADRTVRLTRDLALAAGGQRQRRPVRTPSATPVGFIAYPGTGVGAFGLGLPFGQTDAPTLEVLADLADRFGDGALRTSPWRVVLLGGVRAGDAAALREAAASAGLIADPADRRLSMAACIGSAGCASGTVRAREDAAALADAGWTGFLHVSGCAKGCAHPSAAAVTLIGDGGRYRLVRDGHADVGGLTAQQAAACLA